jgi:AraC-like DNA-binding protein
MRSNKQPDFLSQAVAKSRYLFVDLSPSPRASFAVACAGYEECTPEYSLKRDGFLYYAVEHIISGTFEVESDGKHYLLEPGHVFAYGPQTVYRMRALPGEHPLIKQFVDFSGTEAEARLAAIGLADSRPRALFQTRWVRDIFDQLLDCGHYPPQTLKAISSLLVKLLLMQLSQEPRHSAGNSRAYESFTRCREYIAGHFRELKTANEVASAGHLDPAYLNRLFKKFGTESPYQLLTRLKLEYAAGCLVRHNFSVKQAAFEVGFEDPYHFSRLFKNHFGQAPSLFAMQQSQRSDNIDPMSAFYDREDQTS